MSLPEDDVASGDYFPIRTMASRADALRAALERREPRCRVCRDESVRIRVDELLDWHGTPIILGPAKFHVVTYADILRDLEPLNSGRAKKDRITYNSLWVHAKRHYDLDGILDYWTAKMEKELRTVFGEWGVDLLNRHK